MSPTISRAVIRAILVTVNSHRVNQAAMLLTLGVLGASQAALAEEPESTTEREEQPFSLPPVPVDELRAKAKEPSWDTGLVLAVCGVGTSRPWQATKFCGAGLIDVMFLREAETEPGIGAYAQLGTAGFRDGRLSGGVSAIIPLVEWFTVGARAGGLLVASPDGAAPGAEGYLEFGHRSVSLKSHYAVSHALLFGMQYNAAARQLASSQVIWVGLRLDGFWLSAPAALFK